MNPIPSRRGNKGFTLVELLVVIAIIGILAAMLLPVLSQGKARALRAICGNNLAEQGIAFHIFGHDHNSQFPMAVSTNENGAKEFVQAGYSAGDVFYFGFHTFQTVSNELIRPQLLVCPADMAREAASNFPDLKNQNISYFFDANADFLNASSILIGDRNIQTNSASQPTIIPIGNGSRVRWSRELHLFKGNVLFADGHVEEWNDSKLQSVAVNLSPSVNLFFPSVPPTGSSGNGFGNGGGGGGSGGNSGGGSGGGGTSGSSGNGSGNSMNTLPPYSPANANPHSSQPSSGMNGGHGNSSSPGAKPSFPSPMNGSVNNNGLNRNFGARNSQNFLSTNQNATAAQNFRTNPIAAGNSEPEMSPVDQKIARVLRGTFEWSYFLLLLLLLLFLAYKLWQILSRDKNRRRRNQSPPQP